MWNKSFDSLEYCVLQIIPYLLNILRICPGGMFVALRHLVYGTPGLEIDINFLPILLLLIPHSGH
jgi:hypothetical protein